MKIKRVGRYGIKWEMGHRYDRLWWATDKQGFKTTYLVSAHISASPKFPGIDVLHIVIGPLRILVARKAI